MALSVEERELLTQFMLEAYPNPERTGCPELKAVKAFAQNGILSNPPVLRHISSCSECYSEYRNYRLDEQERKAGLLVPKEEQAKA